MTQLKKNHLNYKPKVTRQTRRKLLGETNDRLEETPKEQQRQNDR